MCTVPFSTVCYPMVFFIGVMLGDGTAITKESYENNNFFYL